MSEIEKIKYPIRINRYLYLKGYCSRRMADKLIKEKKIRVNGVIAVLGQKVNKNDTVDVTKSVENMPDNYKYYLFNKPIGIVSHNPQNNERSVEDVSGLGKKVFPVGRLDKESHGLMLLTDDGRIVNKMLNPKFGHEREYQVTVNKRITDSALNRMKKGMRIESKTKLITTKPAKIERIGENSFTITLTEGKKHQIRRMASALGYTIKDLKRIRIMNLKLNNLQIGKNRKLTKKEQKKLLNNLNIKQAK